MTSKMKRLIFFVVRFSVVGFLLNLVWEYFQCGPFFRHVETRPTIAAMTGATFGDLVMMVVIYIVVSWVKRSWYWYDNAWNARLVFSVLVPSFLIAVMVELVALKSGRWEYTSRNPIIPGFGVSLLPVIQMLLITSASFYFSKPNVFAKCRYKKHRGGNMKLFLRGFLSTAVLLALAGGMPAFAEDPTQDHSAHHPEGQAPVKKDSKGGMMGDMKMDDMKGMMHECMEKHKDGKMCDHNMMQKCEGKMSKAECQKMMKQAKVESKSDKKKK